MNARLFSRNLPHLRARPTRPAGWLFLFCLAAGALALIYQYPFTILGSIAFLSVVGWFVTRWDNRQKRILAESRPGDALCTFARSFQRDSVDPWVVRATFEELQPYFAEHLRPFPIRPSDRIVDDLNIDSEDIEVMAQHIAERAGYSFEHTEQNPRYGHVDTVGDLVMFFTHQPRTRNG